MEEIMQEMKLLNWHKLANEAALKAAILKTKKSKHEDTFINKEDIEERTERIQQIIQEEENKPLVVNAEFLKQFKEKEKLQDKRLENEVQKHIQSLQKLKLTLKMREDLHQRQLKYKEGKKKLKQLEILNNKSKKNNHSISNNQIEDAKENEKIILKNKSIKISNFIKNNQDQNQNNDPEGLQKVITSLDKLIELENRIASLENKNLDPNESNVKDENNSKSTLKPIKFLKKKTETASNEPSKTYYSVTVGFKQHNKEIKNRNKSSVFLTSLPETKLNNQINKKKIGDITQISNKSKRSLHRLTEKERKKVVKEDKKKIEQETAKRQEVIIQGWLKRKTNNTKLIKNNVTNGKSSIINDTINQKNNKIKKKSPTIVKRPTIGAASGKKTNNKHLEQFQKMKKGFDDKKNAIYNGIMPIKPNVNNVSNHNKSLITNVKAPLSKILPPISNQSNISISNVEKVPQKVINKSRTNIIEPKKLLPSISNTRNSRFRW